MIVRASAFGHNPKAVMNARRHRSQGVHRRPRPSGLKPLLGAAVTDDGEVLAIVVPRLVGYHMNRAVSHADALGVSSKPYVASADVVTGGGDGITSKLAYRYITGPARIIE